MDDKPHDLTFVIPQNASARFDLWGLGPREFRRLPPFVGAALAVLAAGDRPALRQLCRGIAFVDSLLSLATVRSA